MIVRLQKAIADAGHSSRRKAEDLIREGRVFINNKQAVLGDKISYEDKVFIDGKKIYGSFHLINEKIDSGKLISSKKLKIDYSSYEIMRSQIYPSMTRNLPNLIKKVFN